jgi:hypothetical protein
MKLFIINKSELLIDNPTIQKKNTSDSTLKISAEYIVPH